MGIDPYIYSDMARIPRGMAEDLNGRVTKFQANQFLELCLEHEAVSDLVYRVGQDYGPKDMDPLGRAIEQCASLGEAFHTYCRFVNHWWGGMDAWIDLHGHRAWIKVREEDGLSMPRNVSNQNGVCIFVKIIHLFAGDD